MMKYSRYSISLLLVLFLTTTYSFAQRRLRSSENIADCAGSVHIVTPGKYLLQFTGKKGEVNDLENYPSLSDIPEENSLWCSFKAPFNGRFSMDASVRNGLCKMIVFTNETNDICGDVKKGIAEIKRMMINIDQKEFGLSAQVSENYYFPIDLVKGQDIMILFLYEAKKREKLELDIKYEKTELNTEGEAVIAAAEEAETKVVDQRTDLSKPIFKIMIRDAETGDPVIADIVINGLRSMSAFYSGSDFLFNVERSGKFSVQCDAEGYFFADREEPVSSGSEHEMVIWLEPIGAGKSVRLDQIEFQPGTSQLLPSSEPKLRRLKDFLALNSSVKVEIQGHVQEQGDNSFAGQKISEARAKRVMKYLIENGIDKKRLTAKGYGNTAPIYPDPKFAYEEQANRRVEIKIL
ncbi:MAG: OmpA family protein [Bacteroidetes bacterium]|nr:MAG: OmpA family protein [Bacteroidota bacterium]